MEFSSVHRMLLVVFCIHFFGGRLGRLGVVRLDSEQNRNTKHLR